VIKLRDGSSSVGDALLWAAAAELRIDPQAVAAAETSRLLAIGSTVTFVYPLMRSAVYHGASRAKRRRAHQALAVVSDPDRDADRRAWHLAAAVVGPDELVAD